MTELIRQPSQIIQIDRYTKKIQTPNLLLMTRSFHVIGKISHFSNWHLSLAGNGIDEISFDVSKYNNGVLCPVWDDLVDLKIVKVDHFGCFEISVSYTDNNQTIKSVQGQSLEAELGQIGLYDFHVNDDDAAGAEITDANRQDFHDDGSFIPTVFYDPEDEAHSLLHRVLADKAPHWRIGDVTKYIVPDEESQPELSNRFQRTYTADGESIYDFLTETVAKESNVIFLFDTVNRRIHCRSLCDCIDQDTKEVLERGIGEDTSILVSKEKLASEFTISSNKDRVKNCFRIEGGDDVITDMVRTANMNSSNYIYQFADFQYSDMPEELREALKEYQNGLSEQKDIYYGNGDIDAFLNGALTLQVTSETEAAAVLCICKNNRIKTNNINIYAYPETPYWSVILTNGRKELCISNTGKTPVETAAEACDTMGIYPKLCEKYDELAYFESSMMPDVIISETTAEEQYDIMAKALKTMTVGVASLNNYNNNLFAGISNNIEAMANVLIDARYQAEVIRDTAAYDSDENNHIHRWTGNIRITRMSDETDYYPKTKDQINACFDVHIDDDETLFTRQKIEKALHKCSMLDIDLDVADMNDEDIRKYFSQYSLNRLKSFYDGYNSCLSILMKLDETSPARTEMYEKYFSRMRIISNPPTDETPDPVPGILDIRQQQAEDIQNSISDITLEQNEFQKAWNLENYLNNSGTDLYQTFCAYRREDTYSNNNYTSDGLTQSECLQKAKELIDAASKEIKKACVLQRTVSASLNNLFAIPEFDPLYDKFALFNYIRIRTEDEILKLRLIGIEFNGESAADISVTFSDQIESVDGKMSDLKSIVQQAASMATSYPSTVLQAKQGYEAKAEISDMISNGLNAARTMLTNNDHNEVTITDAGILCRRMEDENCYNSRQVRITGNGIYLTSDGWETVSMAVGEINVNNELRYGVIADVMLSGYIEGSAITGNTITGGTFEGGKIRISNGTNTFTADPDDTDQLLKITRHSSGRATDIFYIDSDGNVNLDGNINAKYLNATSHGKIANFNISENALATDNAAFKKAGVYLGSSGLSIGSDFSVSSAGELNVSNAKIAGQIAATSLTVHETAADGSNYDLYFNGGFYIHVGNPEDTYSSTLKMSSISSELTSKDISLNGSHGIYLSTENGFPIYLNGTHIEGDTICCANLNISGSIESDLVCGGNVRLNNNVFAYQGSAEVLGIFTDDKGALLRSPATCARTYDGAPNVRITSYGTFGLSESSSKRYKNSIRDLPIDTVRCLYDLPVRIFKYNDDYISPDSFRYQKDIPGFIAEEVDHILPVAVDRSEDGEVEMWNVNIIVPCLLKLIQENKKEIDALKQQLKK